MPLREFPVITSEGLNRLVDITHALRIVRAPAGLQESFGTVPVDGPARTELDGGCSPVIQ